MQIRGRLELEVYGSTCWLATEKLSFVVVVVIIIIIIIILIVIILVIIVAQVIYFVWLLTGRYEITEEDGKQTLVIKDLKLDDAADFTCKIGDRETSAKLQVDEGKYYTCEGKGSRFV